MRRAFLFFFLVTACAAQEPVVLPQQDPAVVVLPKPGATASAEPDSGAPPPGEPATTSTATAASATAVVAAPPSGTAISLEVPTRDPRPPPRARALITTELQGVEQTIGTSTSFIPDVYRRRAELYAELRKSGAPGAGAKAVAAYDAIPVVPGSPVSDEALYYGALEHELAGDTTNARKRYYDLIAHYPSSKWIPFAYFAFGEMFARDAKTDASKWALAAQAYAEVIKYTTSPIMVSEGLLRAGQVADVQGDHARARDTQGQKVCSLSDADRYASLWITSPST